MINLAGHAQATEIVTRELTRCGIPVVKSAEPIGEPKSSVFGELGPFTFKRAWYYYAVVGPVPLCVAQMLYEDPVGRTDIRVAGHCGCPPPEPPWTTVRGLVTGKEIQGDPADGEVFVESYHVDSEVGLYVFARAIKQAGLVKATADA